MAKHGDFLSSKGPGGWYETTVDNEIIDFYGRQINSLRIETSSVPLEITIDNDTSNIWHIPAFTIDGFEDMVINRIKILAPAGTPIKWEALTTI